MKTAGINLMALTVATFALAACGPDTAAPVTEAPAAPADATSYAEFNTTPTIRDVMNTLIDPSADALWNAVRFEMDDAGSRELRPETDDDWAALRRHAISIIEGGNGLMIPGRRVAPPGATTDFPEYEFMPEEVEAKLGEDRQSWIGFAQGLQAAAVDMLDAIEARDADKVSEFGAALDEACEACHSRYWYRSGY